MVGGNFPLQTTLISRNAKTTHDKYKEYKNCDELMYFAHSGSGSQNLSHFGADCSIFPKGDFVDFPPWGQENVARFYIFNFLSDL